VLLAVVAAVVVAALAMTGVTVAAVHARSRDQALPAAGSSNLPTAPGQPDPKLFAPQRDAIARVFAAREQALQRGDLAAWLATVDPRQPALRTSQTVLFQNLRQLPLATYSWSYDTSTQVSGLPVPDAVKATLGTTQAVYTPGMRVRYQLRGFDPEPTTDQYDPLMVERGGQWYVAGDRTRAGSFDLSYDEPWTAGPIKVVTTQHVLVLVSPRDAARLGALGSQADAAIASVVGLWPKGWDHKAVLFATRDSDVFASFFGRNGTVSEASALTLAVSSGTSGPQDVRVVLNTAEAPPGDSFMPVLLRHEFTHVAQWNTQAEGTPTWVIEGIAQYTAYRHHISRARVSREIVSDAKARRWSLRMPASSSFYGADPAQEYHYDMAWLAWEYVGEKYGDSKVVALYDRLATITDPLDSAAALKVEAADVQAVLHMSETSFVRAVETWTARSFQPA